MAIGPALSAVDYIKSFPGPTSELDEAHCEAEELTAATHGPSSALVLARTIEVETTDISSTALSRARTIRKCAQMGCKVVCALEVEGGGKLQSSSMPEELWSQGCDRASVPPVINDGSSCKPLSTG